MNKRVALLIPTLILKGGTQFQMLKLYENLKEVSVVKIFTFYYHSLNTFEEYEKVNIFSFLPRNILPKKLISDSFLLPLSLFFILFQTFALIRYQPTVINAHDWFSSWMGSLYKKLFNSKVKIVVMLNDMPPFFYTTGNLRMILFKRFDEFFSKSIDTYLVLDNRMKKKASKLYSGKVSVIRSGLDVEEYKRVSTAVTEVRDYFSLPADSYLFCCASVPSPHRRFEDAIMALSKIKQLDVGLVIIGDFSINSEYYSQVQKTVDKFQLARRVYFINRFLSSNDRMRLISSLDCLIFPNKNQTWGLTVIEAMALGLPVIVSDDSGVSEVIKHGETGFIFRQGDIEELSFLMQEVINDKNASRKMAERGLNFAQSNFSWSKYAENMASYFQN